MTACCGLDMAVDTGLPGSHGAMSHMSQDWPPVAANVWMIRASR